VKIDESCIARRRFLGGMLGGGAAALGAGMVLPLVSFVGNLREPPLPFLEIAKADYDLAPGTSKMLMYGRIPVLLIRTPRDVLKVFVAICTHFDCTVGYRQDINRIHCACHDGYYFVDGRVDCGPPPRPLDELYTAFRGDTLIIALEREGLEKAL
jgi:arsenite oxidase small subunit